jgi:methylenetetrahydrofolate dehydrogenase (NADP+) / methenyltetrahydrofolate cyclohydrolase
MTARILDGRPVAARLAEDLSARSATVAARIGAAPELAILRLDDEEGSGVYAQSVARAARKVGIEPRVVNPSPSSSADDIAELIRGLNGDGRVAGVVIAQPLPPRLASPSLVDLIDPAKDVDGATSVNAGRVSRGEPALAPATARAVMEILRYYEIPIAGRRAVVVGRSPVIGRPVAHLLLAADATVTICHRRTPDLAGETSRAELLVVAAGEPGLIGAGMVAPGCVVIDCGISVRSEGVVGDVHFAAVAEFAKAITPVPGGVGPVTAMTLVAQAVAAAEGLPD